jgi:hypothetical protein
MSPSWVYFTMPSSNKMEWSWCGVSPKRNIVQSSLPCVRWMYDNVKGDDVHHIMELCVMLVMIVLGFMIEC